MKALVDKNLSNQRAYVVGENSSIEALGNTFTVLDVIEVETIGASSISSNKGSLHCMYIRSKNGNEYYMPQKNPFNLTEDEISEAIKAR